MDRALYGGRRNIEVSEIREMGRPGRPGFKFVFFSDPDGNGWAVQELPRRTP
jgi:hypothetical protein